MFKSQNKLNSKVRFQHSSFRHKLQEARSYKRTPKKITVKDESPFSIYNPRTILYSLGVLGAVAGISYLLFFPNFLSVKTVDINGLNPAQREETRRIVAEYFGSGKTAYRKNWLLLSKGKLQDFLLTRDKNILEIENIKKSYPLTVVVNIKPRVPAYAVTAPAGIFIASNDGQVMEKLGASTTPQADASLTRITIQTGEEPQVGQRIFDGGRLEIFRYLTEKIPKYAGVQVLSYELQYADDPDLTIHTSSGYKLYLQSGSDLEKILGHVQQLLTNVSDTDKTKLFYIDMRFEDRGYVCLKDTPCTKDTRFQSSATTTKDAILTSATASTSTDQTIK